MAEVVIQITDADYALWQAWSKYRGEPLEELLCRAVWSRSLGCIPEPEQQLLREAIRVAWVKGELRDAEAVEQLRTRTQARILEALRHKAAS